jgi:hypothetical protein
MSVLAVAAISTPSSFYSGICTFRTTTRLSIIIIRTETITSTSTSWCEGWNNVACASSRRTRADFECSGSFRERPRVPYLVQSENMTHGEEKTTKTCKMSIRVKGYILDTFGSYVSATWHDCARVAIPFPESFRIQSWYIVREKKHCSEWIDFVLF